MPSDHDDLIQRLRVAIYKQTVHAVAAWRDGLSAEALDALAHAEEAMNAVIQEVADALAK